MSKPKQWWLSKGKNICFSFVTDRGMIVLVRGQTCMSAIPLLYTALAWHTVKGVVCPQHIITPMQIMMVTEPSFSYTHGLCVFLHCSMCMKQYLHAIIVYNAWTTGGSTSHACAYDFQFYSWSEKALCYAGP